jgi:NAD(P)-dependent dehydrogenase (short-subunit alcohol dehydrogenase family)
MSNQLQDQIAIVAGSSSGNGRAIALALSAAGATIVCADLNKKAREEGYEQDLGIDTDDLIRQRGGKACYVQANVRHAAEVPGAAEGWSWSMAGRSIYPTPCLKPRRLQGK